MRQGRWKYGGGEELTIMDEGTPMVAGMRSRNFARPAIQSSNQKDEALGTHSHLRDFVTKPPARWSCPESFAFSGSVLLDR
jgi:hypothetical protein